MEWFSYTIAVILLVSSVVSPIITAIINNKHQLSLKKLDMYEEAKRKSLSDFIVSCEKYIQSSQTVSNSTLSDYYASINNLYIYFEISQPSIFYQLEDTIKNQNTISSKHELTKIVQVLSTQIKKQ